jgi:hypothetical protein
MSTPISSSSSSSSTIPSGLLASHSGVKAKKPQAPKLSWGDRMDEESPRAVAGGGVPAAVVAVVASKAATALPRPRFPPICFEGIRREHFKTVFSPANQFIEFLNLVHNLLVDGTLNGPQAMTALRASITHLLERGGRGKRYSDPKKFSRSAWKMLSQLQKLGTSYVFSRNELVFFGLQVCPSVSVFKHFNDHFLPVLTGLAPRDTVFWLLILTTVLTMTNIATDQKALHEFYGWYSASIRGAEPQEVSAPVGDQLVAMHAKVLAAFAAITPDGQANAEQRRKARASLCLSPVEEDGGDDDAASGISAASAGSTRSDRDSLWRFDAVCTVLTDIVAHLSASTSPKHPFFETMTPERLDELVRGALKKMTCRSSGKNSRQAYNQKIRATVFSLVNKFREKFCLDINKTTQSLILSTSSVEVALGWATMTKNAGPQKQNHALVAGSLLFDLGINDNMRDQHKVNQILTAVFNETQLEIHDKRFATLVKSANTRASKELSDALNGKWKPTGDEADEADEADDGEKVQPRGCIASRGRGGGVRGRGGSQNLGDRDGRKSESAVTVENVAALQAEIESLREQLASANKNQNSNL